MAEKAIDAPERISRTVLFLFGLFFASTLVIGAYTLWATIQFQGLQTQWTAFSESSARKGQFMNNLRSAAGYSGFIHNFKNYIIRSDTTYRDAALSDYENIVEYIHKYRSFDLNITEINAVNEIERTINKYYNNIFIADAMIEGGSDAASIDHEVAVDDRNAVSAFHVLETHWLAAYTENQTRMDERIRTTTVLSDIVTFIISVAAAMAMLTFFYTRRLQGALTATLQALDESEQRFRGMVENSRDAVISVDNSGMIESFNGAAEKMFGYKVDEITGQSARLLFPPDELPAHGPITEQTNIQSIQPMNRPRGLLGQRLDGSTFELEMDLVPFEASGEKKFIGTMRDVTDRKRAEQELVAALDTAETALETRSRFFANVNHELRTPLNAILGFSEAMSLRVLGDGISPSYMEYARNIHNAGTHLNSIVGNILDISKIELGEFELNLKHNNIIHVIESATQMVEPRFQLKNISLEKVYSRDIKIINCDRTRVTQILLNLLDNATKFTPAGGAVKIHLHCQNHTEVTVTISDNGIGVPADRIANVLSPFGQVRSDISNANEGTGLGLPLAKRLVEQHGGAFHFTSSEGVGTTVSFSLPVD